MIKAFKFRLKEKNLHYLNNAASSVNFIWNFCADTATQYLDKKDKWLSEYEMHKLITGCAKDLNIVTSTVQAVASKYIHSRSLAKSRRLKWRSKKRSLSWVPFSERSIKIKGASVIYNKIEFRIWKSREIEGKIKSGEFFQDVRGRWYLSLNCEVLKHQKFKSGGEVGIDLGLKTIATLSNGHKLDRENITTRYASKLATAQRARKKKRVKAIHAKIKNTRQDWSHKQTTKLINSFDRIIVGDVSSSKLKKTRMAKSVSDASWADFKSMLAYKAIALGVEFKEVKENFSTVTCSACLQRTGPNGLRALGVREWTCKCGAFHNRDVNAAINILRSGYGPPKGATSVEVPRQVNNSKN